MEKNYAYMRKLLLEHLALDRDNIKRGSEGPQVKRRIQRKEKYKLRVNCPHWRVAVLYDDIDLYRQLEKKEDYLFSGDTRPMYYGEFYAAPKDKDSDSSFFYREYDYNMLWYCASQNEHVTEDVLLESLGAWSEKSNLKNRWVCKRAVNGFFEVGVSDWKSIRQRAKKIYAYAPEQLRRLLSTEERKLANKKLDYRQRDNAVIGKLFLLQLMIADGSHSVGIFQQLLGYLCAIDCNILSCRTQFMDYESTISCMEYFMKYFWSKKELIGNRILELLLWGWAWAKSLVYSEEAMLYDFDCSEEAVSKKNKVDGKLDQMFRQMVLEICRKQPETVQEIFKRKKFYPSQEQVRFLSKQVFRKRLLVSEEYLEDQYWGMHYWNCFDEQEERAGEDILFFQSIRVKKRRGKSLSMLEREMISRAAEDMLWAAAKADFITSERMPLYLEFSRQFGGMKAVPTLLAIQLSQKGEIYAG